MMNHVSKSDLSICKLNEAKKKNGTEFEIDI